VVTSSRRSPGDGSVFYSEARKRWRGVVEQPSSDGGRKRKWVSARSASEARRKVREVLALVEKGVPVPDDRLTVASLLDRWLKEGIRADVASNTRAGYDSIVRLHVVPKLGALRVRSLRPSHVNALTNELLAEGKSRSSAMRARSVLKMALHFAEVEGLVNRNVAALANPVTLRQPSGRSLDHDQARALLAAADGDPLEAAIKAMLMLGLRPGEALGLPWDNVDFATGTLAIRQSLKRRPDPVGGRKEVLSIGATKTPRSQRVLKAPQPVLDALSARRSAQRREQLAAGPAWTASGLVFSTSVGTPVDPSNLRRSFDRICAKAGLGHWTPNEMRHSAVSILSAAGVPIDKVADLVGHDGTRMTMGVYRHLFDPVIATGKEPMEALFGTGSTT